MICTAHPIFFGW